MGLGTNISADKASAVTTLLLPDVIVPVKVPLFTIVPLFSSVPLFVIVPLFTTIASFSTSSVLPVSTVNVKPSGMTTLSLKVILSP